MVEMPVCQHSVPIKFGCFLCNRKGDTQKESTSYYRLEHDLKMCLDKLDEIESKLRFFSRIMDRVAIIEERAQESLDLFVRKAHDLKKIDAKRDDVINSLCQKIMQLEERLNHANTRR